MQMLAREQQDGAAEALTQPEDADQEQDQQQQHAVQLEGLEQLREGRMTRLLKFWMLTCLLLYVCPC